MANVGRSARGPERVTASEARNLALQIFRTAETERAQAAETEAETLATDNVIKKPGGAGGPSGGVGILDVRKNGRRISDR